jgi:hypothetical protein
MDDYFSKIKLMANYKETNDCTVYAFHLESSVGKSVQKMKKMSRQQGASADQEKLQILLNEVQKLKNQIFYLQQTIIHIRAQA